MIVNTTQLFPEGRYKMMCIEIPSEELRNGMTFWRFKFETTLDGQRATYEEFLPVWLAGPMFKALGFPEVRPGSFDVEPTMALQRSIEGTVVHETIEKGNKAGQIVSRLKDMKPIAKEKTAPQEEIPF